METSVGQRSSQYGSAEVGRQGRHSRRGVPRRDDIFPDKTQSSKDVVQVKPTPSLSTEANAIASTSDIPNTQHEGRKPHGKEDRAAETQEVRRKKVRRPGGSRSGSESRLDGSLEGEEEKPRRRRVKATDDPTTGSTQTGSHVVDVESEKPPRPPTTFASVAQEAKQEKTKKKVKKRSDPKNSIVSANDFDERNDDLTSKRSRSQGQGSPQGNSAEFCFAATDDVITIEEEKVKGQKETKGKTKKKREEEKEKEEGDEEEEEEEEEEKNENMTDNLNKDINNNVSDGLWHLFGMRLDVLCRLLLSQRNSPDSQETLNAKLIDWTKKAPHKSRAMETEGDEGDGLNADKDPLILKGKSSKIETKYDEENKERQSETPLNEKENDKMKKNGTTEKLERIFPDRNVHKTEMKFKDDAEGQRSLSEKQGNVKREIRQDRIPDKLHHGKTFMENATTTIATGTTAAKTNAAVETVATETTSRTTLDRGRQQSITRVVIELDSSNAENKVDKKYDKSDSTPSSNDDDDDDDDDSDDDDDDRNLPKAESSQHDNRWIETQQEKQKIIKRSVSILAPSPPRQSSSSSPPSTLPPSQSPSSLPPSSLGRPPMLPPSLPRQPASQSSSTTTTTSSTTASSSLKPVGMKTLKSARSVESLAKQKQPTSAGTGSELQPEATVRRGGSLRRSLSKEWQVVTVTTREEIVVVEKGKGGSFAHAQSISSDVIETGASGSEYQEMQDEAEKMKHIDSEESFEDSDSDFAWPSPPHSPLAVKVFLSVAPPDDDRRNQTRLDDVDAAAVESVSADAASLLSKQTVSGHVTSKTGINNRIETLTLYGHNKREAKIATTSNSDIRQSERKSALVEPSDVRDLPSSINVSLLPQTNSFSVSTTEVTSSNLKNKPIGGKPGSRPPTGSTGYHGDTKKMTSPDDDDVFVEKSKIPVNEARKQADYVIKVHSSSQEISTQTDETDGALGSDFKTRDVTARDVICPTVYAVDSRGNARFESVANSRRALGPSNEKPEVEPDRKNSYYVIAQNKCVSPVVMHEYGEHLSLLKKDLTVADMERKIQETYKVREDILRRLQSLWDLKFEPLQPLRPTRDTKSRRSLIRSRYKPPPYNYRNFFDLGPRPSGTGLRRAVSSSEPFSFEVLTSSPPRERFSSVEMATSSKRPFSDSIV